MPGHAGQWDKSILTGRISGHLGESAKYGLIPCVLAGFLFLESRHFSELNMSVQNPFDQLSFFGPWRVDPFSGRRRQQLFTSLSHWYETARFDERVEPELVSAAIEMPSPKIVRKFASRHASKTRLDWPLIRSQVLMQGLHLLYLQNRTNELWLRPASEVAELLSLHGVQDRMNAYCIELFLAKKDAPLILVLGAASAPSKEVGRRMNALHKRTAGVWAMRFWLGRNVCWEVHDWADSLRLPISYAGKHEERLSTKTCAQLVSSCDQVVLFECRGGRTMDKVAQAAKLAKKPIDLHLWSLEPNNDIPEVGDSNHTRIQRKSGGDRFTEGDLFGSVDI